jgi:glycosyltransferase involved in cell wall biosynthesis
LPAEAPVCVVTPVYNGAKYLPECIESVLAQTYANWRYVVSDNCSSDGSLGIARAYAERDERILVREHEEHLAHHIASWNRSMREITPEARYVKVVHADDWLYPECLERMVARAEEHPSVGLVGAYRLDEDHVNLDGLPPATTFLPGAEVARSWLLGRPYGYLFGSPSSTLLRADLVRKRQRFYNEENIHADAEACLDVLSESDFGFVHQVLTYTRRHNEAVTAFTRRAETYAGADVGMYLRWGPVFCDADEYRRKLFVRALTYAGFLLRRLPRLRQPDFRRYHLDTLRYLRAHARAGELARGLRLQLARTLALRGGR